MFEDLLARMSTSDAADPTAGRRQRRYLAVPADVARQLVLHQHGRVVLVPLDTGYPGPAQPYPSQSGIEQVRRMFAFASGVPDPLESDEVVVVVAVPGDVVEP